MDAAIVTLIWLLVAIVIWLAGWYLIGLIPAGSTANSPASAGRTLAQVVWIILGIIFLVWRFALPLLRA